MPKCRHGPAANKTKRLGNLLAHLRTAKVAIVPVLALRQLDDELVRQGELGHSDDLRNIFYIEVVEPD